MRDDVSMPKADERAAVPAVDEHARRRLALALDREGVVAALLIGSQAAGTTGPLSDVDIAAWVEASLSPPARIGLRDDLLAAATDALGTDQIDLVLLNDAPPLLAHRAMRDGIRIVERDHAERVRFETAALLTYLDTAPLRDLQAAARRRRLAENRFGRR